MTAVGVDIDRGRRSGDLGGLERGRNRHCNRTCLENCKAGQDIVDAAGKDDPDIFAGLDSFGGQRVGKIADGPADIVKGEDSFILHQSNAIRPLPGGMLNDFVEVFHRSPAMN